MTDPPTDGTDDGPEAPGDGSSGADEQAGDGGSTAERFRRRIRELEERLESTDDEAERDALRRDLEHLRSGLRAMEGPEGGS